MTAAEVVDRFRSLGYMLVSDPPAVVLRGPGPPPDELSDELRRNKLAIIEILTAERVSAQSVRKLVAIEYDPGTRLTTRFYSDGTQETPE